MTFFQLFVRKRKQVLKYVSIFCPFQFIASSLVLLLLFLNFSLQAQHWIQQAGGLNIDEGYDLVEDANGNTYATGYFTGTATFGSFSLTSSGSTDIYIVKINSQGGYDWAKKAGGSGSDRGLSIALDLNGSLLVTGYFYNTASFGTQQITSTGAQDIFIAKYNSTGTVDWVKKAGGPSADIGNGICSDLAGNVYLTGSFQDTATFGTTSIISAGASDIFITKLNSNGVFSWTTKGSGPLNNIGFDIGCDNSGNVYTTGQFSGNLTFDVVHTNTMYNAIYTAKHNTSGVEQWFKVAGAGTSNISNSIAVDGQGNSVITGDFLGTLTFFGSTNVQLNNTYTNRIFLAKYNNSGALSWAKSAGSESSVTSNGVALDASGNAYIVGEFECKFDEYSDYYGSGVFNSVGNKDIYIAKYSSGGIWQYSKQIGGKTDDYGLGISAKNSGNASITGSFSDFINVPISTNFNGTNLSNWTQLSCSSNTSYCSDATYGEFVKVDAQGNKDIFIGKCFDPNRETYDYFMRNGSVCNRPFVEVCIDTNCPSLVSGCNAVTLHAITNICPSLGPDLNLFWNGTLGTSTEIVGTSGTYYLERNSQDGCFTSIDSIEVIVHPNPPQPDITDDQGINTNSVSPSVIRICIPDSALLTAGNTGANSFNWTGPNLPTSGLPSTNVYGTSSGFYTIGVIDSNGCENFTTVELSIEEPLDSMVLALDIDDTVSICDNKFVKATLYDSLTNPNALPLCLTQGIDYIISSTWTVSPFVPISASCETYGFFSPQNTGLYTINVEFIRSSPCGSDTLYATKSVYVNVNPSPVINPQTLTIVGSEYICPGDSTILSIAGNANPIWFGPDINGATSDSVWIYQPAQYNAVLSVADTNQFGCVAAYNTNVYHQVLIKPQPSIFASNLLICPNDSIQLISSASVGITWEGPNGIIPSTDSVIYVSSPGTYYTVVNDADSCDLVSNSVTLHQYATPQLLANGNVYLCDGDSVEISVVSSDGSLLEWQTPLSGTGTHQVIYSPGTYTCKITSCGIVTYANIDVFPAKVEAEILFDSLLCEGDSILLFGSDSMFSYLWYPTGDTTQTIVISDTGYYALTTFDSNQCFENSDTVKIEFVETLADISLTSPTTFCAGDSVLLTANSGVSNYLWNTGDTTQSIEITEAGFYSVVTIDSNGCEAQSDALELFVPDTSLSFRLEGETYFCEDDSAKLKITVPQNVAVKWFPSGQTSQEIIVNNSGTYSVTTIDTFGCKAYSDSIEIEVEKNNLLPPITSDTLICAGLPVTLSAKADSGTIAWYDDTGNFITNGSVFTPDQTHTSTTYFVATTSSVCRSKSNAAFIEVEDCESVYIPNVFTPNGDGSNEYFSIHINGITCFNCKIYNRWGLLIYEMKSMDQYWDGTVLQTGKIAVDGTYYYILEYCKYDGSQKAKTGYITLLREDN